MEYFFQTIENNFISSFTILYTTVLYLCPFFLPFICAFFLHFKWKDISTNNVFKKCARLFLDCILSSWVLVRSWLEYHVNIHSPLLGSQFSRHLSIVSWLHLKSSTFSTSRYESHIQYKKKYPSLVYTHKCLSIM